MGAYGTGAPLYPNCYIAGTITLAAANTSYNLQTLVQTQLDANCPGSGYEINIQADGSGIIYIGEDKNSVGALSSTNYGYALDKAQSGFIGGSSRTYRSGVTGSHSPVGDLWVLSPTAGATLHVEITN